MLSSLRGRFLITAIVLVALVLPAVFNTQKMVSNASEQSEALIADYRTLQLLINDLEQAIQSTETQIYQYSIQLNDGDRQQVLLFLGDAKRNAKRLKHHSLSKSA